MMGEASEAVALHEGGEDGGGATGGSWVSGSTGSSASSGIGTASSGWSSSSLFSTTTWSVGDEEEDGDGATSSPRPADRRRHSSSLSSLSSSSSTSSLSEASHMSGVAGGPLYGMSTIGDHIPPAEGQRTGLSKFYKGRSESFTSLADVSCVEDLAKKTTPYIRRSKPSERHAAALGVKNRLSKTAAKKAPSGRKPSAASECEGKRDVQMLGHAHANEISTYGHAIDR